MKNIKSSLSVLALILFSFSSCSEHPSYMDNVDLTKDIVGDYIGYMAIGNSSDQNVPATVNINKLTSSSVEVNFQCEVLDTMIIFDLYENMDSVMVCLTGDDFNNHYGHSKSGMHHIGDNDDMNDWGHHMDDDHQSGDRHFGGFDMINHTFNFSFWDDMQKNIEYKFEGKKL